MAIFDRLKFDPTDDTELVWKFPSENLILGSQLIVQESQEAIFRRNGKNVDFFSPGNYTLSTSNLPLLNSIINFPFGGKTPFTAEVWFINKTPKRDLKWGTTAPIPLIDPKFGVPVNVRAFGQWGIEINDSIIFLDQMVGARSYADTSQIYEYFRGELIQDVSEIITSDISTGLVSVFNINSELSSIVNRVKEIFNSRLNKYGITLTNFSLDRISIPQEELARMQEIMLKKMEAEQLGSTRVTEEYRTLKTLDILNKAAENTGGGVLPIITQVGLGNALSNVAASQMTQSPKQQTSVEEKLKEIKSLFELGLITQSEFDQKKAQILEDI
jgi:membrane protease subunit (stomatin/prohibitin family)